MNHPIMFLDQNNKTRLAAAPFSYFFNSYERKKISLKAHSQFRDNFWQLKLMKNTFHFASKALPVLKIFSVMSFWSSRKTA